MDLAKIFERAAKEGASDVLLTVGAAPVLYIGGKLLRYGNTALTPEDTQRMVYGTLMNDQIAEFERERELDFSFSYKEFRFRGNAYWQRNAVGAAFRLIQNEVPNLSELGLPPQVKDFTELPQGLILVTGPTGHGKSTTLASMIDHVNRSRSCHIVTIEDPIEFAHTNRSAIIDQREVGTDTPSFASAVRHVLRQAPHIILVGEMRDLETISAVLTAAETGHLVFATLHTNDCAQTIDRIIDVYPPHQQAQIRVQLSMALRGIVSQRLLPKADGDGRVLAVEVMHNVHSIANLIRTGKTQQIEGTIETGAKHGMVSLDASIKELFLDGQITEETAQRTMKNPSKLGP
jgi:twitching motility protein PilT